MFVLRAASQSAYGFLLDLPYPLAGESELFANFVEGHLRLVNAEEGRDYAPLPVVECVEYAVNLIARRSLPGFGDGGGLTDQGYSEIAEAVKGELEKLEVYRRES